MSDPTPLGYLRPRILVVDGDREVGTQLAAILRDHPVDVLMDGSRVPAQLLSQRYDIVIADLTMPGLSGIELLRMVKPHRPELEFIVLTGNGSVEAAVQAMKMGASEFLLKPVNAVRLREVVHRSCVRLHLGRENRQLRNLYEKQKLLEEMRDRLVILINHELRTPLTALKMIGDEMLSAASLPQPLAELQSVYQSSVASLELLAEDLRSMAETRSGELAIVAAPVDPPALLRELLGERRQLIAGRDLDIRVANEDSFAWRGDAHRIRQIVEELLANAVRATPDGGSIRLSAQLEGRGLLLRVADSGIGIPKDKQPLVFEPFLALGSLHRYHSSRSAFQGGGLGVGLYIVRDLVRRMGGSLGVISDSGMGCVIEVRLPETPSAAPEASRQPVPQPV